MGKSDVKKSVLDWINEMPSEYRLKAIENMLNHNQKTPKYPIDKKTTCLSGALVLAFIWKKTPEGYKFWNDVYLTLKQKEDKNGEV